MYEELSKQLDAIGYDYKQHELKKCTSRAQQKQAIKAMLIEAQKLNFDVYSNQAKAILAAIASEKEISVGRAVSTLRRYVNSDAYDQQMIRETLFSAALRASEEFRMVIILNGEGVERAA